MAIIAGILITLVCITGIAAGVLFVVYKKKNKRIEPDYYEYYKSQDTVPRGKVGVFIAGLIMPEHHDDAFFYNITKKIFSVIIPWPFRVLSQMDKGVALFDPVKYHEHEEFVPTQLEDPFGNDCDIDGEPYIEKYRRGEVVWGPPSKRIWLDHGYFIYKGRKGGMPTLTGKTINRSRLWYYKNGIRQKKLPHWEETFKVINGVFDKLREKYGNVECGAACSLHYHRMRQNLVKLLDAGCETIVLSSPLAIYSHFEDFNSTFYHCFEYIEEWEKEHPGKKIKVIIAPPMGHFQPMRQAFLDMLKDRLDTLPEGSDVTVAVTVHGMPWDVFPWEAWLQLAPAYRDKLYDEVRELLKGYTFGRTNVVICQDEFANPVWDPKEKYLSTNQAYKNAVSDGYDYAIGLPIEFFSENSDTLFHHAQENYHGFDEHDVYEEIDYPDWSIPYSRELKQGKTTIIYNGLPVGKYQTHVTEALYQSLDGILDGRQ